MANKKSLMEAFEVEPKVFSSNEDVNDYDVFRNKNLLEELRVKIVQNLIKENIGTNPIVTITYFVPDDRKSGGAYISNTGVVKKINEYNHTVVLTDKTVIPIEQISEMQSDIFSEIY